jgi:hypothetical protein
MWMRVNRSARDVINQVGFQENRLSANI